MPNSPQHPIVIGWCELIALPDLGIAKIRVKTDTGAATSALHATDIHSYVEGGGLKVKFAVPATPTSTVMKTCTADVLGRRLVKSSSGHQTERLVILTRIAIGTHSWPVELTLTNRKNMQFPMLLGRTAMIDGVLINPRRSYLQSELLNSK